MNLVKIRVTDTSLPHLKEIVENSDNRIMWERKRKEADGIDWYFVGVATNFLWAFMNDLTDEGFVIVLKPDLWQFHGKLRLSNVETSYSYACDGIRQKVDFTVESYDVLDAVALLKALLGDKKDDIFAKDNITVSILDPEDIDFEQLRKDLKDLGCKMRKNYNKPGYKIVVS